MESAITTLLNKEIDRLRLEEDTDRDIVLEEGLVLSGKVVDESGTLVPAQVRASLAPVDFTSQFWQPHETFARVGTYRLVLAPGSCTLTISPWEDKQTARLLETTREVELSQNTTLDIVLETGHVLYGTVMNPDRVPVAQTSVEASNAAFLPMRSKSTFVSGETATDGSYRLLLPSGTYTVSVDPSRTSDLPDQAITSVTVTGDTKLDIALKAGVVLSGKVTDEDGKSLPGVQIVAGSEAGGGYALSLPDGTYRIVLSPTTYSVRVSPPRDSDFLIPPFSELEVNDDRSWDIMLKRGVLLSGRVIASDDAAVQGSSVSATSPAYEGRTTTSNDGMYRVPLLPGIYTLEIVPPPGSGFAGQRIQGVDITTGRELTIQLNESVAGRSTRITPMENVPIEDLVNSPRRPSALWEPTSGPYGGNVVCLLAAASEMIYAGTEYRGLLYSEDGGDTWHKTSLGEVGVSALAQMDDSVYAAVDALQGNGPAIFRSSDGGESWTSVEIGVSLGSIRALETLDNSLYIGTAEGLFRLKDGLCAEVDLQTNRPSIWALASWQGTLYVGTEQNGVLCTQDGGHSWAPTRFEAPFEIPENARAKRGEWLPQILSLMVVDATLYAGTHQGVWRFEEETGIWQAVGWNTIRLGNWQNPNAYALGALGQILYTGTDVGVFRLDTSDSTWHSTGLSQYPVHSLAVTANRLYAGTEGGGIFHSEDNGNSWAQLNVAKVAPSAFAVLRDRLYVGTYGDGVFYSVDRGKTWVQTELTHEHVTCFAKQGETLYAGTDGSGISRYVARNDAWERVEVSGSSTLTVSSLVSIESKLYAGMGDGIFLSQDGGDTWMPVNTRLTGIFALAASDGMLYIGTDEGAIFRSPNSSDSWNPVGLVESAVSVLMVDDNTIYAGTADKGIFRADGDGLWTPVNEGLSHLNIRSLITTGSGLYAGTLGGLFFFANGSHSWQPKNEGLSDLRVLALIEMGTDLYAGTADGVFRTSLK